MNVVHLPATWLIYPESNKHSESDGGLIPAHNETKGLETCWVRGQD